MPPAATVRAAAPRGALWSLLFVLAWLLAGCNNVRLVADYDAEAAKGITDTSAAVFSFYDRLISARAAAPKPAKLAYAPFADDWGKVETQIRVMLVREESRPLNSDSEKVVRTILDFWKKYRQEHLDKNDYNAAQLGFHRDRFQRLFAAALKAEKAKLLANPDTDPAQAND